jgi:hypothetical protein
MSSVLSLLWWHNYRYQCSGRYEDWFLNIQSHNSNLHWSRNLKSHIFFTYTWGKFKNSKFIYNYICGVKVNVLYLNIDTCNYVIKGGIEQMTFEYHFFTYTWGKFKNSKFIYNYICGVKVIQKSSVLYLLWWHNYRYQCSGRYEDWFLNIQSHNSNLHWSRNLKSHMKHEPLNHQDWRQKLDILEKNIKNEIFCSYIGVWMGWSKYILHEVFCINNLLMSTPLQTYSTTKIIFNT